MFLHKFIGSVILSLSSPCRWLHEKYTTVSSMGPSSQLWRWSLFAYRISCPRFKLYNSHHQTEYKSSTVLQSRLIHVLQKHIEHLERHLLSQIFHDLRHICSPQGYLNHVSHWSDKFRSTAHIIATRFTNTYIYIYYAAHFQQVLKRDGHRREDCNLKTESDKFRSTSHIIATRFVYMIYI